MFSLGGHAIDRGIFLAPMEDISDISFRLVCKDLGADFVYTEFVNSEGLVRKSERTHKKMRILDEERPVGIQIYGGKVESMIGAAQIAEKLNPDIIDINAGCWVKGVVGCGAGAGLLKDPAHMQQFIGQVVKSVNLPVTVKTRIGWDSGSIHIEDIAMRLEDVGVQALTIHCRTRSQAHNGDPDWSWIEKVKACVRMPIILNGGLMSAADIVRAFHETPADAVMVARGAIGNPWIFAEAKAILSGTEPLNVDAQLRIKTALKHLFLATDIKGELRAILEHRKFYTGYLKGLRNSSTVRAALMKLLTYADVHKLLMEYLDYLMSSSEENFIIENQVQN